MLPTSADTVDTSESIVHTSFVVDVTQTCWRIPICSGPERFSTERRRDARRHRDGKKLLQMQLAATLRYRVTHAIRSVNTSPRQRQRIRLFVSLRAAWCDYACDGDLSNSDVYGRPRTTRINPLTVKRVLFRKNK